MIDTIAPARRSVDALDDAEVAFDAVGEGPQRLLVRLALVCRDGLFKKLSNSIRTTLCVIPASWATTRPPRDRVRPPPARTAAPASVL
jgi:hypothetical protein